MYSFIRPATLILTWLVSASCPVIAQETGQGQSVPPHQPDTVHLTQAQLSRLDLQIDEAVSGSASALIRAPASIEFDADRVARVGPLLNSRVVSVTRDLGDAVNVDDTLAILESVDLGRTRARYLRVTARLESISAEFRRDEQLHEKQLASEAEMIDSRAALREARAERDALKAELRLYGLSDETIGTFNNSPETPLSRYELKAPMDGVIQARDLRPGEALSSMDTPIHIVNHERLWLMIQVYEQHLPRVAPGQTVEFTVRALPGQVFEGETDWVSRALDEASRTLTVRAIVDNANDLLRAGMFGTARIFTGADENRAMVPVDAVQTIEERTVVFLPGDEDGSFQTVDVITGDEQNGLIEIRRGLSPGEQVVTGGAFDLMSSLTAGSRSADHSH